MSKAAREAGMTERLAHHLPPRLVVYDGVCALCSGSVRWIAARDDTFHFVPAQSPLGTALLEKHGLPTRDYSSFLTIIDGAPYTRLDGVIAVLATMGWPWKAAQALKAFPKPARDWIYARIAQNRFMVFGRVNSCELPAPELRSRLLE